MRRWKVHTKLIPDNNAHRDSNCRAFREPIFCTFDTAVFIAHCNPYRSTHLRSHYNTNFRILELAENSGKCWTYIQGMGIDKKGNSVLVHARYDLHVARTPDGWKIARFEEPLLMPLGDEVAEMHG